MYVLEGLPFRKVKANDDCLGTSVERLGKTSVLFLSSCVPDKNFDWLTWPSFLSSSLFHYFYKVNAQCCTILVNESFARVGSRKLCLTHTCIANQDYVNFLRLSLYHSLKELFY